jgi:hypothetical protein
MTTRTPHRVLAAAATLAVLTLLPVCGTAAASSPDPDGLTPPQPTSSGQGPVSDDGAWTIETMLAARHSQLTTTWWASLF